MSKNKTKSNQSNPNILLVEGAEDQRVIPQLIEANGIKWENENGTIVNIKSCDGYENLINPYKISSNLKTSGLSALGIMIDADENPLQRWQSIRNACLKSIPDIPVDLSEDGLIHHTPDGIKFGIWMMPDNQIRGMLETFLTYMIPDHNDNLWQFAQKVTKEAKNQGANFKENHYDKANIYTWLAWQDPPGRQLHDAIIQRILNPNHPKAQKFVTWFKDLYSL